MLAGGNNHDGLISVREKAYRGSRCIYTNIALNSASNFEVTFAANRSLRRGLKSTTDSLHIAFKICLWNCNY
ncbi:hypothetical protein L1987_83510 [Smallanthus sonchifolius]|uniref:Uncharacterized protein n=1 Tax=Smallanthus sonchifolius TaxID=185202 RepID=A0ACB8YCE4_9ASTR|nr:hypothetical protein L1987_83510 [Smallanthus sonchifolius]